ncbi:MAG TPA: hypothetical protein VJ949_03320, partial [Cryomorphaceae bacterium]|nr:hypothetical protein [Cryomorphaceae bacterium]
IASAFFLPLLYFVRRKVPSGKMLLKAVGIALLSISVALLVAVFIRSGEYIYNNFLVALHYVSGNQAHGFSQVAREFDHHFFIVLFLLPMIACTLIFMSVKRLFDSGKVEDNFSLQSSLFFFLIFLGNFPRGLVRHGFLEAQDGFYTSTFFLALALFVVSFFKSTKPFVRYSIFCCVSVVGLLTIKYFPLPAGKSPIETFFTQSSLKDLDKKVDLVDGRVKGHETFAEENFNDLNDFLNEYLDEDQTFLDFSNTPMLYFYTGREVPSYFAQSLQNSIDDFTQLNHLARLDTNRVPVVIFSHYPPAWMDATDGVANSMRYYPIAEYIYKNYRPATVVNDLNVWLPKSQLKNFSLAYDDPLATPDYHYGYAPVYIYKHFESETESLLKIEEVKPEGQFVALGEAVQGESSLFLSLSLTGSGPDGLVVISLYSGDKKVGMLQLFASESEGEYMLPLTNSLSWHEFAPNRIRIEIWNGMELESVGFYKDLRSAD